MKIYIHMYTIYSMDTQIMSHQSVMAHARVMSHTPRLWLAYIESQYVDTPYHNYMMYKCLMDMKYVLYLYTHLIEIYLYTYLCEVWVHHILICLISVYTSHWNIYVYICRHAVPQQMAHEWVMSHTPRLWLAYIESQYVDTPYHNKIHASDVTQTVHAMLATGGFMYVTWLIHSCDMTHSCVWHDSFVSQTVHAMLATGGFICVTWLMHLWDMTHSCVWHDSFVTQTLHAMLATGGFIYVTDFCVTQYIHVSNVMQLL